MSKLDQLFDNISVNPWKATLFYIYCWVSTTIQINIRDIFFTNIEFSLCFILKIYIGKKICFNLKIYTYKKSYFLISASAGTNLQPETCLDKISNCNTYPKSVCSGDYFGWSRDNCPRYCGFCTRKFRITLFFLELPV